MARFLVESRHTPVQWDGWLPVDAPDATAARQGVEDLGYDPLRVVQLADHDHAGRALSLDAEQYAPFGERIAAVFIDAVLVICISVLVTLVSFGVAVLLGIPVTIAQAWDAVQGVTGITGLLGAAFMESSRLRGTPGMLLLGLAVARDDSALSRASFLRALLRNIGAIVSTLLLGLGWFMPLVSAKRQMLHDAMAGCVVVRRRWPDSPAG